jgi:2-polyprenyl-3-methyl-5-hydroxy-6-metoxy-1,4-benzoquinol methylase
MHDRAKPPAAADLPGRLYDLLERELDQGNPLLSPEQQERFRKYYGKLVAHPGRRRFYRYNWRRRIEQVARLLRALAQDGEEVRILDAGCGYGTESILWGGLARNVRVLAVDCDPRLIRAARERLRYYAETLGRPLSVEFVNDDAVNVLSGGGFDMVWAMEAVSHIHPAERFLAAAAAALAPGGYLAVSDSNLLNPIMALQVWRLRWRGVLTDERRTEAGLRVRMVCERLFSRLGMLARLRGLGLAIRHCEVHVFFPPWLPASGGLFSLAGAWDRLLGAVPGLKELGGVYTIVAQKRHPLFRRAQPAEKGRRHRGNG